MSFDAVLIKDHQAWLGYIQEGSSGLVVSPAALTDLQVVLDKNAIGLQEEFREQLTQLEDSETGLARSVLRDNESFLRDFLNWPADCLAGFPATPPLPDDLSFILREYDELLRPTFALRDPKPADAARPWLILGVMLGPEEDFDAPRIEHRDGWQASHTQRLERLLRETKFPVGLLVHREAVRLFYAPHGENSGYLTFPIGPMVEVAGRPIVAAMEMLLGKARLLTGPREARLQGVLEKSRVFQANVSTKLAGQVLDSLYELLRGFEAANQRTHCQLLERILENDPNAVYRGLLTVLMRLVFLLYAEDRGIMPEKKLYQQNYSIHDLFIRLRDDAERYPDTMDQRYGAWPRLLALFRAIHDGCKHPDLKMPPRRGHLFDPDRFPFLEGRRTKEEDPRSLPLVPDGIVHRILQNLLVLDGERLSYRILDVEQIGSVYETMMGFRLEVTEGLSIALKPGKKMGAPVVIDLEDLLAAKPADRARKLEEITNKKFDGKNAGAIKDAQTVDDLLAALNKAIARNATPHPLPRGVMALQPTDERRRSGSHYTPRKLTLPIVAKTMEPVLASLGPNPTPQQILDLKVCDIAMGSGAFLVEACRQLAEALVKAWQSHNTPRLIPSDETEYLYAMRRVAQRCLYGVDKNPMAVDLAKLSLWLATLAKDHPFTFLDHSLRWGDSLVGLTREQIVNFTWEQGDKQRVLGLDLVEKRLDEIMLFRREIIEADEEFIHPAIKRQKLDLAEERLNPLRDIADLIIEAFFFESKERARKERLVENQMALLGEIEERKFAYGSLKRLDGLRSGPHAMKTFHWQIEFPEIFTRKNGGFDAIVGNPPFLGVTNLSESSREGYTDYLRGIYPDSGGKADLVAFFFRRAGELIRSEGCLGLIATNTIAQGDTRRSGLLPLLKSGCVCYSAVRRFKWPGAAAVIVSVLHICRSKKGPPATLDGQRVNRISAFLIDSLKDDDPSALAGSTGIGFLGSKVQGIGFVFDDENPKCPSLSLMHAALAANPKCREVLSPYVGGEDLNEMPSPGFPRWAINFGSMEKAEADKFPEVLEIARMFVYPQRKEKSGALGTYWWQYAHKAAELHTAVRSLKRILVIARVSKAKAFTFLPAGGVINDMIIALRFQDYAPFATLQSRLHLIWDLTLSSTLKDDPRYSPSDGLVTFPFPADFESNTELEAAGKAYYEFRADLMVKNDEGLTKTYNRFHDPQETNPDILRLRELHTAMDRAVLHAYGWDDIPTACEFILDYEDEDDELDDVKVRRKKKPWRYRWPDDIHDDVLARLLALNAERAKEEAIAGAGAAKKSGKQKRSAERARTKRGTPDIHEKQDGTGVFSPAGDFFDQVHTPQNRRDFALAVLNDLIRVSGGIEEYTACMILFRFLDGVSVIRQLADEERQDYEQGIAALPPELFDQSAPKQLWWDLVEALREFRCIDVEEDQDGRRLVPSETAPAVAWGDWTTGGVIEILLQDRVRRFCTTGQRVNLETARL